MPWPPLQVSIVIEAAVRSAYSPLITHDTAAFGLRRTPHRTPPGSFCTCRQRGFARSDRLRDTARLGTHHDRRVTNAGESGGGDLYHTARTCLAWGMKIRPTGNWRPALEDFAFRRRLAGGAALSLAASGFTFARHAVSPGSELGNM